MSEEQVQSIPEKEAPADAPDEDELELIDEENEALESDASDEAATEAGMSTGSVELDPTQEVRFEKDESGEAQ